MTLVSKISELAERLAEQFNRTGVINVKDYGAVGDGTTNDTTAIADAYTAAAGKPLYFPPGTYLVTALPDFADRSVVTGGGPAKSLIKYAGTGTLRTLTGKYGLVFRDIGFWATGAGATLLQLSGCFRFSFERVIFRGAHDDATGSTYRTQVGLKLDNNTGATFISHCDFENLGIGLQTSCIQNQVMLSKFTVCYRSVYGVGGTANAGLSIANTEFVGGDVGTTETHIYIDGSANCWVLLGVWFEKSDYACRVGVGGTGGPSQWVMIGCKIGAKTTGLDLIYCRQPILIGNEWDLDQGGTQDEIAINATNAEEGVAIANITTLRSDFVTGDYPQYWSAFWKGTARFPNLFVTSNADIAGTIAIRGGSPGAGKVLTSDADGDATWQAPGAADATLTALAGLTTAADQMIYSTGADAFAMTGLTSTARSLLDDSSASAMRTTLGLVIGTDVQAFDSDLNTIAGLTATTDNFIVAVSSAWASRTPAQVRTTLGLVIGTNVQAWDADLDTWATKAPPSGVPVGTTDTQTISGKRITKRSVSVASNATPTINTDNGDFFYISALAVNITNMSTNLTGTPTEGQTWWFAITGTAARTLAWGTSFESSTVTLPTTTVSTNRLDVGFIWNTVTSKWRCVAVA